MGNCTSPEITILTIDSLIWLAQCFTIVEFNHSFIQYLIEHVLCAIPILDTWNTSGDEMGQKALSSWSLYSKEGGRQ